MTDHLAGWQHEDQTERLFLEQLDEDLVDMNRWRTAADFDPTCMTCGDYVDEFDENPCQCEAAA